MTAPGRYCIDTCYCGSCPQFVPVRRPVQRFHVREPARRYPKVTTASQALHESSQPKYSSLPYEFLRRGNPDELGVELLGIIADDIENKPRNLQVEIGPSGVGSPCARKVGYGLLQIPKLNPVVEPNWKAYVGTGVHLNLEGAMDRYNVVNAINIGHDERFYVETRLQVGEIAGVPLVGHCDVYDRVTATVIDWKTCGPTQLKSYRSNGPGPTYRRQAHLYARGWNRYLGLPVDRVMLVFFPRQGELRETHVWHEPYDEEVALAALGRADAITATLNALGPEVGLAALPPVEDYCGHCDWFAPGGSRTGNLLDGCPGQLAAQQPAPALTMKEG